jgi:curved DNA-binding protein CbpA
LFNWFQVGYFKGCLTISEVKKRYRELAKKYHPDNRVTGDTAVFRAIVLEYEILKKGTLPLPGIKPWGTLKRRNQIRRLIQVQEEKQLKKLWVYFAFQSTLAENRQALIRSDLEYIALQLGYKPAWVDIKCKEHCL